MMCKLYKITVGLLWPNDYKNELIFWAYHFNEDLARDAAMRYAGISTAGQAITNIISVDEKK